MNERRDALVKHPRAFPAEEQPASCHRRPSHPELFASSGKQLAVGNAETLGADLRLSVAPKIKAAREGPIIRVPDGYRRRVETADESFADGALATVSAVNVVMKRAELEHRNRVEPNACAGRADRVRERGKHLMLPFEITALSLSVANAERDVVLRDPSQRTVTEHTAEQQLFLIGVQGVVLDRREHFVAFLDLGCRPFSLRREDQVVRRTGELSSPGPARGLDLEANPLVGLPVLEVADDLPR